MSHCTAQIEYALSQGDCASEFAQALYGPCFVQALSASSFAGRLLKKHTGKWGRIQTHKSGYVMQMS